MGGGAFPSFKTRLNSDSFDWGNFFADRLHLFLRVSRYKAIRGCDWAFA